MSIKDRLEEWQARVDFCEARIGKLIASMELFTHSMMVIPYVHTGELPPIFRPNDLTPWGHYRDDIERAVDNLIELEAEGLVSIPRNVKEAFKTLIQLGQEEKLDEQAMDDAYRVIVEDWFFLEGTGKVAEACVAKGGNPKQVILWDIQMQSHLGSFDTKEEAERYADKHFMKNWREFIEIREVPKGNPKQIDTDSLYEVCMVQELCHKIIATSKAEAIVQARDKGEIDALTKPIKDWTARRIR